MTIADGWQALPSAELPHKTLFDKMDWLRWHHTPQGGMISEPIIEGGGSASWVKSKLLELDINSTVKDCESTLSGITARQVLIPPSEIQNFCGKHAGNSFSFSERQLVDILKLSTSPETVRTR